MQMRLIRETARNLGIRTGKLRKGELIKRIQIEEGNFDCFGTAREESCDQINCIWRDDCFLAGKQKQDIN